MYLHLLIFTQFYYIFPLVWVTGDKAIWIYNQNCGKSMEMHKLVGLNGEMIKFSVYFWRICWLCVNIWIFSVLCSKKVTNKQCMTIFEWKTFICFWFPFASALNSLNALKTWNSLKFHGKWFLRGVASFCYGNLIGLYCLSVKAGNNYDHYLED